MGIKPGPLDGQPMLSIAELLIQSQCKDIFKGIEKEKGNYFHNLHRETGRK